MGLFSIFWQLASPAKVAPASAGGLVIGSGTGDSFDRQMTERTVILAKTLRFFGHPAGSKIDFAGFAPMLRGNAALGSKRDSSGLPSVSVSQSPVSYTHLRAHETPEHL